MDLIMSVKTLGFKGEPDLNWTKPAMPHIKKYLSFQISRKLARIDADQTIVLSKNQTKSFLTADIPYPHKKYNLECRIIVFRFIILNKSRIKPDQYR
jgi:hypothetical protein